MQTMNLISVLNAYESLNETLFSKYLNNFGVSGLRVHEINSLKILVQNLTKCIIKEDGDDIVDIRILDGYYIGYSIPQIGKEFDLLKFANDSVINIELKKEGNKEKILKQLSRNRYYLSFIDREINCITYVSDENKLYELINKDGADSLAEIDFPTLYDILSDIEAENLSNIDTLLTQAIISSLHLTLQENLSLRNIF